MFLDMSLVAKRCHADGECHVDRCWIKQREFQRPRPQSYMLGRISTFMEPMAHLLPCLTYEIWWNSISGFINEFLGCIVKDPTWNMNKIWLVVYLPLWKIWKSVGMGLFPLYGKVKVMFQSSTKQFISWYSTWNMLFYNIYEDVISCYIMLHPFFSLSLPLFPPHPSRTTRPTRPPGTLSLELLCPRRRYTLRLGAKLLSWFSSRLERGLMP